MNNFRVGDFVYFSLSDKDAVRLFTESGLVIGMSDNIVSILSGGFSHVIYNVVKDSVRPVIDREKIIDEINTYYWKEIKNLESQLKSVKRSGYKEEIVSKYCHLKEEILNTARHMIDSKDDADFESKLKAICQKKKQLFEIPCEELNDARKHNGRIKYKIKELNEKRQSVLLNLDKSIDKLKKEIKDSE